MRAYIKEFRKLYKIRNILEIAIITNILLVLGDKINIITKILSNNFIIIISALIVFFIMVRMSKLKLFDLFSLNIINDIDFILTCVLLTSGIFSLSSILIFMQFTYRAYISILIIPILILILIRIGKLKKQSRAVNKNIYDLKELYEGTIQEKNKAILIDEESVDYDLLDRNRFINNLYNVILDNKSRKKFVVGLQGHWGSGKSTILNILKVKLKDNKDIIIIDDFDPWDYNDQSIMFRAMFDTILKHSEIGFSMSKSKKFVDDMCEIIFDTKYGKHIKKLDLSGDSPYNDINKIKEMVNTYLAKNNKKVIFIIDNIDRAEKENVYLLFKLVGSVLSFENIIYILSYDDSKVKNVMNEELKIDYDYLKKIIQLEIKVPNINENIKHNIIDKCIKNLLELYGIKKQDLYMYDSLIHYISEIIKDIRDFKRFLNSVITFYYRSNKALYPVDTITIEIIKMYNIDLYQSIIDNRRYFISEDKQYFRDLCVDIFVDKAKFNLEGKGFFDSLFGKEENKKFINLVAQIFPYVNNYNKNKDLVYSGNIIHKIDKEEQRDRAENKRIYSAKFFDLYFTETSNDFTKIIDLVEAFITLINESYEISEINLFINNIHKNIHKEFFEILYLFIDKISKERLLDTISILFTNIYSIDNSTGFMELSALKRTCIIISDILLIITDDEFDKFVEDIDEEYSKLQAINNICYWMNNDKEVSVDLSKKRCDLLNLLLKNMSYKIYDNNINIYEDYYKSGNIYGFKKGIEDSRRDIKTYIKEVLNEDTIIKFLVDIISKSTGTKVTYYIKKEEIDKFTTEEEINLILDRKVIYTDKEKLIRHIYDISMELVGNDFIDDERLTFNEELDLEL